MVSDTQNFYCCSSSTVHFFLLFFSNSANYTLSCEILNSYHPITFKNIVVCTCEGMKANRGLMAEKNFYQWTYLHEKPIIHRQHVVTSTAKNL